MTQSPAGAPPGATNGTEYGNRPAFLIAMYEQLMGDINRHIVVVWQMVGVLGAAVAGLVLAEKQGVPTAYAAVLVIIVAGWVLDHLHDGNFWYNRNLVMITNIERIFLTEKDIELIHPYFAAHRKKGSFLTHLKIQRNYSFLVVFAIILYFTVEEVIPTFVWMGDPDFKKWAPFAGVIWLIWRNYRLAGVYDKKYEEYLAISPGLQMASVNVNYGTTHGHK